MNKKYFLLLLVLFLVVGCTKSSDPTVHFSRGGVEKGGVFVEVVDTPETRQQGLMHRETLAESFGMLFVFEREDIYGFWMKNTLIPLDMIFISKDFTVVDIIEADPCVKDPCPTYTPEEEALYVLEVNKGFNTAKGIVIGDTVLISHP